MTKFQLFITILGAVKFTEEIFRLVAAVEAPRGRREAPRRHLGHRKTA